MAIYHCSVKTISRGQGRSAVAAAAYRSGEEIKNEQDGITHDYQRREGVVHTQILAPEQAPAWAQDRAQLWNKVEEAETRKNSRTAREVVVAIPKELNREQQLELVRDFAKENFVDKGMVADIALHSKENDNEHGHIMLTTREIDSTGFTNKNRDWDKKENLESWRKSWEQKANLALERAGHEQRIDHRSYEAQGIDKIATVHLGPVAHAMEKRGVRTDRGNINREIKAKNDLAPTISRELDRKIELIEKQAAKDIAYFEKFIAAEKTHEPSPAAPASPRPQQEKPAQKSPERPQQPQKEEVQPETPTLSKEPPVEKWERTEITGTVKEWGSFCSQKYREFRDIASDAAREVMEIQKKIDKLHEPYLKEAAEQHLTEKYQPQLDRIEKDFQEHLRQNAEHNKKSTLWNRIVHSDQVTANAERLERQEEILRRDHAAVKESWSADKAKVEKGIIPDGSGSPIRTIAMNLAKQRDPSYEGKKATLEKSKLKPEGTHRKATGIATKYSKLATKFQMIARSVKMASKLIKLPGIEKTPAAGGGAGAGAQEVAQQNQSLLAKAASHLAGEKSAGITPLTAKVAEDMSIDWDALTPDELKMKLAQIELQRESRGLSL